MKIGETLIQALRVQAQVCRAMGSPFSAELLEHAASDAEAGGPAAALFQPWADASREQAFADAVALRWLGAMHDLALSKEDAELSASYPSPQRRGDADKAWNAALNAMIRRADALATFMEHEPQTNEVRRSVCLLGGFLQVAFETALPLRTLELGASAGLNQLWDQYHYVLGPGITWGGPSASVRLDTDWRGPGPQLAAPVPVLSRLACDRKPVDLADPRARRRLEAYIWPDQTDRLLRLKAAVRLALENGVAVETADALDFVQARARPTAGCATVIYHSVFWQYLPASTQASLTKAIAALAEAAGRRAPLGWLRMEPQPENIAQMEVRLTLWPGGTDRRLARCHPHGAWVEWETEGPR